MKKWLFVLGVGIFTIVMMSNVINSTFAYPYNLDEAVLFYEDDYRLMEENIGKYLKNIDDLLIVNSSFELSDILVENYDFLVYFAMDYIFLHYESYQDKIISGEDYYYTTRELEVKSTNQYISLEEIYVITDRYFGVRDFSLVNVNIKVVNDYVTLIDYTELSFSLELESVQVEVIDDIVYAKVYYENDVCYLYAFSNENYVLKLMNIEVVS